MVKFRIALAQINTTVGDFKGNTDKIVNAIKQARDIKANLVAFPELAICGYPPEDLILKPHFVKENLRQLNKISSTSRSISVVVGLVHQEKGQVYNAAAFLHHGRLVDVYHKILLPNYGVFDEKRYFQPGQHCPIFMIGDVIVGINICEDIWHSDGPHHWQARSGGAHLIINISASPYHEKKIAERERLLKTCSRENKVFTAYVNLVGGQDELVFDGGSMIFAPDGRLIARGNEFKEDFIVADLDIKVFSQSRRQSCSSSSVIPAKAGIRLKQIKLTSIQPPIKITVPKKLSLLEEIYNALVLGTRDYIRKNGFQKVVLGLSGGIDSALVAAIACDAIGSENVKALTMPSPYSSAETQRDSEIVALNLGIELIKIPITDIFQSYRYQLKDHFIGRPEDTAEENLQARVRGNFLMFFSNKLGWLVLTTGNKSEMSTGYCTLYGDMAGGFAVIKDVPKTLVYKLADFYNKKLILNSGSGKGQKVIPLSIFRRPPMAELRPNQKDQDSLPPYEILDPILDAYVEQDLGFSEIIKKGFDEKIVQKVISLVDSNEYKRRQAPPGVKITPKAFGKDRRMPITNKYRG